MINRASLLCVVVGSMAVASTMTGCLQQLDSHASDGVTNVTVDPKLGIGGPFPIIEDTPPIAVNSDPETGDPVGDTTTDPCVKTVSDANAILRPRLHDVPRGADGGREGARRPSQSHLRTATPSSTSTSTSTGFSGWKYIVPGDPENSLIYHRVAVVQDMPKHGARRHQHHAQGDHQRAVSPSGLDHVSWSGARARRRWGNPLSDPIQLSKVTCG